MKPLGVFLLDCFNRTILSFSPYDVNIINCLVKLKSSKWHDGQDPSFTSALDQSLSCTASKQEKRIRVAKKLLGLDIRSAVVQREEGTDCIEPAAAASIEEEDK